MARERQLSTDDRSISATITVVLLIGITLVGVVVIIAAGVVTINDANDDANMEVVEESMLQVDSTFQQSSGTNTTMRIPSELEGQVSISNNARYNLTLNGNQQCSTKSQNLSSIEYESNGQTVAYQGGGVWRMTDSGATMTSPPDITYDDGSLSFSFIDISGDISTGDELQTNASGQVSRQRQMELALYTNQSYDNVTSEGLSSLTFQTVCQPNDIQNATLRVEGSQYARAWDAWARQNYDDRLVWTNTSGQAAPGDTIEIHFLLGDVSEPYFEVSDVRYTRASSDDPVEVTATVTNTGGLETTRQISVIHNGNQVNRTDLTLDGDEQTELALNISESELEVGQGTINVSANNTVSRFVDIDPPASDAVPETTLSEDESISSEVGIGEPADGTVVVESTGGMTAIETVTLTVGGETVRTWNRTLNGSETATLDIGAALPTDEEVYGETITISGDVADNSIDGLTYTVAPPGAFSIQSVSAPSDAETGDDIDISATIENIGSRTTELPVTITLEDPGGSEVVDEESTVGLASGGTTTVTEDYVLSATGEYRYFVETPNETTTGSFHTDEFDGPNFRIVSTTTPDRARIGTTAQFGLTVENSGDVDGTRTLEVLNESGDVVASQDVSVSAGGTTYPTVNVDISRPDFSVDSDDDEYTIRFAGTDAEVTGTIDVHDDSVIQCEDGECTNTVGIRAEITLEGAEYEQTRGQAYEDWERVESETFDGEITGSSPEDPIYDDLAESYTTEISGGNAIRVEMTASDFIPYLIVTDEDGNVVEEDIDGYDSVTLWEEVDGDGTYTIWAGSYSGTATDEYDLEIEEWTSTTVVTDLVDVSEADYPGDPSGDTALPGTTGAPTALRLLTDGTEWGDGPLWEEEPGGGNVNAPAAEAELIENPDTYTMEVTLDPGTDVSFGATRYYYCSEYDDDNYVIHTNHQPTLGGVEFPGVADIPCEDWDTDDPVGYDTTTDSAQNVITYNDGDDAVGIDQANPAQIPLRQMVDGQIDENGQYDLATDERIYAIELDGPANPDYAGTFYDYNDAIIRYNAIEIVEETTTPASFEINSIDRPVQVSPGDSISFDATIENIGDEEGTTELTASFEGSASVETADGDNEVTLDGGGTEEITIALDSTGVSPTESNYDWEVNAEANPTTTPEASGSVYVGNGDGASSELTIATVEGPLATDDDEPATAIVGITNVGNGPFTGSQTVTLHVDNETDGTDYSVDQTFDGTLSTGGTDSLTFDLPDSQGEYSYDVTVSGSTSRERAFFVGTSSVDLRDESSINIGTYYYNTSTRIERDGGIGAMNLRLENTGTIGDDREVQLTVRNNTGDTVFSETHTVDFGEGDIRTRGSVRNTSSFDTNLGPGYYTYDITVLEDSTVDATATGNVYLRNTSRDIDDTNTEDSPVDVGSSAVTVSD